MHGSPISSSPISIVMGHFHLQNSCVPITLCKHAGNFLVGLRATPGENEFIFCSRISQLSRCVQCIYRIKNLLQLNMKRLVYDVQNTQTLIISRRYSAQSG